MNVTANIKTLTSAEFEHDAAQAKRAAESGPVFIVTGGTISHVLMTKTEFDRLDPPANDEMAEAKQADSQPERSLADILAQDGGEEIDFDWEPHKLGSSLRDVLMHPKGDDFDFDPPRMRGAFRPAEFE